MSRISSVSELSDLRDSLLAQEKDDAQVLTVCGGPGCQASGCLEVAHALRGVMAAGGHRENVQVKITGCHGFCEQGPIIVVEPGNIFYCRVKPCDVREIVEETVRKGRVVERLLYVDPATGDRVEKEAQVPFYKAQSPNLLSKNRLLDPMNIDDYLVTGGYQALAKVLADMSPGAVIREIQVSGLRGRCDGFSVADVLAACRHADGEEKYVVGNADERDPGAFRVRALLEGNPHTVIEGMLIGAYAIGASQGYIYVRNEYPQAVEHAREAVRQARASGLLGEDILGSGFTFDIELARGGGVFVCGESTALLAAIEGKVAEPREVDVPTWEHGLWNHPTALSDVETWANIPSIIDRGGAWFAGTGSRTGKGTKVLSITGQVKNTGLVEVPLGTTIGDLVEKIGGGPRNGGRIKAVQTGGPSGTCLPSSMFHLPIDFDTFEENGSMIGSGGFVVLDDTTCVVDMARYFLGFFGEESCGKCIPCRIGVGRLLEIVTDIAEGRGRPEQIELLEELGQTVAQTALCRLGRNAPNPVFSALKYFRDEIENHIVEKRCPAGVCRPGREVTA